jgi:MFS family permease
MFKAASRLRQSRRNTLWTHADFRNLWAAESISQFGSQITLVALPLVAALVLGASASQMGMLAAAGTLPYLLLSLFAGVWVDRLRRRTIMIVTDFGRALLLLSIPVVWALGSLHITMLYIIAFLVGVQTLFFDVAYISYLPRIVERHQLTEGNAKLQASASTAQVAGPGAAGVLVGVLSAPLAIVIDAVTYLFSAFFLLRIRIQEPEPERAGRIQVRREIGEGLRTIFGNPVLRAIAATGATSSLFGYMFLAVYILYMIEDLGFSPMQIGLVFSLGGAGAIAGSLASEPLKRLLGVGPTVVWGRVMFGVGGLLVPLAVAVPRFEVPMVLAAEFLQWTALVIATVNEISLRQALVPDRMLGRANATMRFMNAGVIPVGSLIGGFLGELIGLRGTLVVGVAGMLVAGAWVALSPLRSLRTEPAPPDDRSAGTVPAVESA